MAETQDDVWLGAWRRLVADPDEGGAFAALVHGPLTDALEDRYPWADPHAVATAVGDAVLAFLRRPAAYDLGRLPLFRYLLLIARRRLSHQREREGRHHRGRIPWDAVELAAPAGNEWEEDELSFQSADLQPVLASLSDAERRVLELMRDGERSTAAFVAALGLADRPVGEREAVVKRVKDRIKARLKRAAGGGT